jgi:pSer/pThr/pTyr-binding forkhead associated (FHA) protein
MGIRLILEEHSQETEFNFDLDDITIGRTADNTIRISSKTSSRQHCRISKTSDGFIVEDLKSRNGTMLNGEDINKRVLTIGDRIEIGTSIIHFSTRLEGGPREESPTKPRRKSDRHERDPNRSDRIKKSDRQRVKTKSGARKRAKKESVPEPGRFKITFLNPPREDASVDQFPFMIGSRESNALVLDQEDVASEHCMLVPGDDELFIVDLGSKTGTLLNGEEVTRDKIESGCVLKLGGVTMRLVDTKAKSKAKPKKARLAVDEITDLNDLDGDDEDDAAPPPPRKEARKKASARRREAKKTPKSDRNDDDVDMLEIIEEDEKLGGQFQTLNERAVSVAPSRGGGVAAMVQATSFIVALVVIAGTSVSIISNVAASKDADPAADNNLVANWSFESALAENGQIPGWNLERDSESSSFKIVDRDAFGEKALRATLAPDSEVKVSNTKIADLSVEGHKRVAVSGQFSVEGKAAVGLKVLWYGEGEVQQGESLLALSSDGGERRLTGSTIAPYGAVSARLVAFANATSSAKVFVDRLEMSEEDDNEGLSSMTRDECVVECDKRGVATLIRPDPGRLALMATGVQVGLVGKQDMTILPFSEQEVARIESPLKKRKRRLRFKGAIYDREEDIWRRMSASIEVTSNGMRFDYGFDNETMAPDKQVFIRFDIPSLRVVNPIEVINARDQNNQLDALFKGKGERIAVKDIVEMAWGRGAKQISLKFSGTTTLVATKLKKGLRLEFILSTKALASGTERAVNFQLVSSSSMVQTRIRAFFATAEKARSEGDLGRALTIYRKISRQFDFDKRAAQKARQRAKDIRDYAQTLAAEIAQAVEDASRVESPAIEISAASRFKILEAAFPSDAATAEARRALQEIRNKNSRRARIKQELRAKQILELGKRYRERGRLALARSAFKLLTDYYPADFPSVREAKVILERRGED